MADKTINTRIQLRNDLAATWDTKNPILLKGEMGVETDTRKIKIGDGTTAWKTLSYIGADANDILAVINENRDNCTQIELTQGQTDADGLATITSPKKGDTAIVSKLIVGDKKSYTAYVYNGENWAACDGNYSADNVYFDEDLTYTVQFGTLAKPSGSAKFAATGKNVTQVLSALMAQEANPSKTAPAVSFSAQGGFGTFEIGTKKTLSYTAALSAGSYTYGPATGITAQTWEVTCTGVEGSKTTATGSFENVVAESTAKTITAKATYNDGAIPKTNLGNPYAAGQIKAGSASKTSNQLVGVRYMFWGPMTEDTALTSTSIRALSKKEAVAKKTLTTFGAGSGAKKVVVAVPAGYKVTKVLMPSAMNADATASFVKQGTQVQVEGAEGYAATAYDVWVYQSASIDSTETYAVTIG